MPLKFSVNHAALLLLSLSLLGVAGGALAEKADAAKPTNVEADHMAYDDVKQVNTFTGNVVLTRGTLTMKAQKMIVTQDPAGYQYATLIAPENGLATFRQKRDGGPDLWVEGEAKRIEYDNKNKNKKQNTKTKQTQLEGSSVTDQVEGAVISYDSKAEFYSVNNTPSGEDTPGGGRIKAVIQPRNDAKGQ